LDATDQREALLLIEDLQAVEDNSHALKSSAFTTGQPVPKVPDSG
jgi:hypothetical protein